MDVRRLLNIVYAHLTRDLTPDGLALFLEALHEKFDHEMTKDELRRTQVRRKERELGIVGGDRALMDAFSMPTGGVR